MLLSTSRQKRDDFDSVFDESPVISSNRYGSSSTGRFLKVLLSIIGLLLVAQSLYFFSNIITDSYNQQPFISIPPLAQPIPHTSIPHDDDIPTPITTPSTITTPPTTPKQPPPPTTTTTTSPPTSTVSPKLAQLQPQQPPQPTPQQPTPQQPPQPKQSTTPFSPPPISSPQQFNNPLITPIIPHYTFDTVNIAQQTTLETVNQYRKPPLLIPMYNKTLHTELQNTTIDPLQINTKTTVLSNTFNTKGLKWLEWDDYLQLVANNQHEYESQLTPLRRKYETTIYQAQYAKRISLDTNPPTIEFITDFAHDKKTIYATRPPHGLDLYPFEEISNHINSTNPFQEYLQYNSTSNNLRRQAIAREITHSFGGYSLYSFGSDEFYPTVQGGTKNWGFGLTIVDALDTLILTENEEHIAHSIEFIANKLHFGPTTISIFETTIRGLGGLLAAYAQRPQHTVLLERAVEIGDLLLDAFLPNRLPENKHYLFSKGKGTTSTTTADFMTLQIEFETLSRFTGNKKYALAVRELLRMTMTSYPTFLLPDFSYNGQVGTMVGTRLTIGARVDSAYEYLVKLWVLHGRPPYKLPLKNDQQRTSITWMNNIYTLNEQDILWDKYEGIYDNVTGVYIPLYLYYQFILHLPSLFLRTNDTKILFPAEFTTGGEFKGQHDHLNCFIGGVLAFGVAHGAHDDLNVLSEFYHTDCIHKELGIPCDFINTNSYYSYQIPQFNPKTDTIAINNYITNNVQLWANELTHTCIQTYAVSPTQISPEVSWFNIDSSMMRYYNKASNIKGPLVQDLYELFRAQNDIYNTNPKSTTTITNEIPIKSEYYTTTTQKTTSWFPPGSHWDITLHYMPQSIRSSTIPIPTTPRPIPPVLNPILSTNSIRGFGTSPFTFYLLRPETVESIFFLWRTTKHEYYREVMWSIFLQIVFYCRVDSGGYSTLRTVYDTNGFNGPSSSSERQELDNSLNNNNNNNHPNNNNDKWTGWASYHAKNKSHDELFQQYLKTIHGKSKTFVTDSFAYGTGPTSKGNFPPNFNGKMESWFLGETIKYIYLTFADELLPIDRWVFNTEAHAMPLDLVHGNNNSGDDGK